MAIADLAVVFERMGALERHLLASFSGYFDSSKWDTPDGIKGHVSIIKNGGLGSGGSLSHGAPADHFQQRFAAAHH